MIEVSSHDLYVLLVETGVDIRKKLRDRIYHAVDLSSKLPTTPELVAMIKLMGKFIVDLQSNNPLDVEENDVIEAYIEVFRKFIGAQ